MAEYKRPDEATLARAVARGIQAAAKPYAVSARYDKRTNRVQVALNTGIGFHFDPHKAYGLENATPDELAGVTVEGAGSTLRFPRLDADFTVARLLEGFLGPTEWSKREARAAASRENGKRGGRPRKRVVSPA